MAEGEGRRTGGQGISDMANPIKMVSLKEITKVMDEKVEGGDRRGGRS